MFLDDLLHTIFGHLSPGGPLAAGDKGDAIGGMMGDLESWVEVPCIKVSI